MDKGSYGGIYAWDPHYSLLHRTLSWRIESIIPNPTLQRHALASNYCISMLEYEDAPLWVVVR